MGDQDLSFPALTRCGAPGTDPSFDWGHLGQNRGDSDKEETQQMEKCPAHRCPTSAAVHTSQPPEKPNVHIKVQALQTAVFSKRVALPGLSKRM